MLVALVFAYWIILVSVTIFAWRCGGGDEKVAAALISASSILTPLARAIGNTNWQAPQVTLFGLEVMLLSGLLALALESRRYWPMTAASCQLLCVLTHPAMEIDHHLLPLSYAMLQGFWAYPMLLAIVVGTINHRRMMKRARSSAVFSPGLALTTVH